MVSKIFLDIEQGTEHWHGLRMGKITASNFGKIMAKARGGNKWSEGAIGYAEKKALEIVKGERIDGVVSYWMKQGVENEPIARAAYEKAQFLDVTNGGYLDAEWLGASSDGRVTDKGKRGGIEIKCVKYTTHYKRLKKEGYDPSYKWQLIGNVWLYDFEFIDFVSYCHDFPDDNNLFIHRTYREEFEADIMLLKKRVLDFKNELLAEHIKLLQ